MYQHQKIPAIQAEKTHIAFPPSPSQKGQAGQPVNTVSPNKVPTLQLVTLPQHGNSYSSTGWILCSQGPATWT